MFLRFGFEINSQFDSLTLTGSYAELQKSDTSMVCLSHYGEQLSEEKK